jgi:hypothetical protein
MKKVKERAPKVCSPWEKLIQRRIFIKKKVKFIEIESRSILKRSENSLKSDIPKIQKKH